VRCGRGPPTSSLAANLRILRYSIASELMYVFLP
jgi:hypothetical protein